MVDYIKQIRQVNGEKIFYFSSSNLNQEIEYISKSNISSIELNPYVVEFSEKNIDFLRNLKNLEKLSIVALENIDISNINTLSSLKTLYLDTNKTKRIDFSNMNLTELNIRYSKSMEGICLLHNLSKLVVSFADTDLFSIETFSKLNNLETLEIYQSNIPSDFEFLKANKKLTELNIGYIKKPFTLEKLELLNLKILKIMNCGKTEIKNIGKLITLEELHLVDSVIILDNKMFLNLHNLKDLIVLGKSYFCDGSLIELQNKLEYLGIDNKKHYNVKYKKPQAPAKNQTSNKDVKQIKKYKDE